ncbi:MAG: XdhC/CoxF family protein [Methylobacterium sp.]|nr:MAG: XdhC/CoxF family protein [Methylobacterium sp.]
MKLALLSALNARIANREATVLVTEMATGATRLVTPEQVMQDPLGEVLAEAFRTGKSGLVEEGRAFLNVHLPPVKLIVTGAVHISQALAEMARLAGLDCTIIDPRTAFATPERFPNVTLLAEWPDQAFLRVKPDRFTAFVALTHDPKIDDPGLVAALRAQCFYIGALGSRKTHAKRVERLQSQGFSEAEIARIHAPIGLDIGAVSPPEIAVSILGEIIATMRAKRRAA